MIATEQNSLYDDLENKSIKEILTLINFEDKKVALCVEKNIKQLDKFIDKLVERFLKGGRLFYIGAGTSGRLGVLDASEIPPTFGFENDRVIGIIAGGDIALRNSVENAEDFEQKGWEDLSHYNPNELDTLVGIAASGHTPYVFGALKNAFQKNILTACITSNPQSRFLPYAKYSFITEVGPEFVTGSSRMKSGTAQKLILNMISTTLMIKIGRVQGNKMTNMALSNTKLIDRGRRILEEKLNISNAQAQELLDKYKSIQKAIEEYNKK